MKSYQGAIPALFALFALLIDSPTALAATRTVDCQDDGEEEDGDDKKKNSINAALARLSKQGPHTVKISGNCTEFVFIDGFDSLTLTGNPVATINAPGTPGSGRVIFISNSRNVIVRNLTLNGQPSIWVAACHFFSHCVFHDVTAQGGSVGISFARSRGTIGDNTVLQNNIVGAEAVVNSHVRFGAWPENGGVTVLNNGNATDGGIGISITDESYADVLLSTVQDNEYGPGILVLHGSFVGLFASTVSGNGHDGIAAASSSFVRLRAPSTITGNSGSGIGLGDLTFLQIDGNHTINDNGQPDVDCRKSTAKTQGTGGSATPNLGGGTTNCIEPTL